MLELLRTLHRLTQPLPVLDMTTIGTDPRVKNIAQGMFPQKHRRDHPHTLGVLIFGP